MRNLVFFIVVISISFSCEQNKCFYGTGEQSSLLLTDKYFNTLEVYGLFDIELVSDTSYYIEAFGGKNVINNTEVVVEADSAYLYNYNGCFWMRDYKRPLLKVHFPDIKHIDVHEACLIFSTDTVTDGFSMYVKGRMAETKLILNNDYLYFVPYRTTGGKFVFEGKTDRLTMYAYYNAVCDASKLKAEQVRVGNYSIADCRVNAASILHYEIFNTGNILLTGNPKIVFDTVTSSGKLIYVN